MKKKISAWHKEKSSVQIFKTVNEMEIVVILSLLFWNRILVSVRPYTSRSLIPQTINWTFSPPTTWVRWLHTVHFLLELVLRNTKLIFYTLTSLLLMLHIIVFSYWGIFGKILRGVFISVFTFFPPASLFASLLSSSSLSIFFTSLSSVRLQTPKTRWVIFFLLFFIYLSSFC